MKVNEKLCLGCGRCQPYCTMGAIGFVRDSRGRVCSSVDQHECVDCGVCYRAHICDADALYEPKPEWPRSVRGTFSNPLVEHKETRVPGRGTEEMKTNDVTGRFKWGEAGMAVEMGRPGRRRPLSPTSRKLPWPSPPSATSPSSRKILSPD